MVSYNPLKTKYSQLENSEVRRESKILGQKTLSIATLVERVNQEADMDIAKMPPNQTLKGRKISLLKNEFKINVQNPDQVLTLWRVEIKVSSNRFLLKILTNI